MPQPKTNGSKTAVLGFWVIILGRHVIPRSFFLPPESRKTVDGQSLHQGTFMVCSGLQQDHAGTAPDVNRRAGWGQT
jgi:hypothetical protein